MNCVVQSIVGAMLIDENCYGSVKNGFDSAILTKIPRMEEKKGLGRRQTTKCGAKPRLALSDPSRSVTSILEDHRQISPNCFGV
jgi:hypothetical protein